MIQGQRATRWRRFCGVMVSAATGIVLVLATGATPARGQRPLPDRELAPPGGRWIAQTGPNDVTLVWEAVRGATGYAIYGPGQGGSGQEGAPLVRFGPGVLRAVLPLAKVLGGPLSIAALGPGGARSEPAEFNTIEPARTPVPVTAPASVTARESAPGRITVSWTPVAGAVAYAVGRSVVPYGFRVICPLCPSSRPEYVDTAAAVGAAHAYGIAAVFPWGSSRRTMSNTLTPGAPLASADTQTTTTTGTTPITVRDQKIITVTAGSVELSWAVTSPPSAYRVERSLAGGAFQVIGSPAPTVTRFGDGLPNLLEQHPAYRLAFQDAQGTWTTVPFPPAPPPAAGVAVAAAPITNARAEATGPAAVRLSWSLGSGTPPTSIAVSRLVRGTATEIGTVPGTTPQFLDSGIPATVFDSTGWARIGYMLKAVLAGANPLQAPTNVVDVARVGALSTSCPLNYQRADNMWAASGRPDGNLGVETITLSPGQKKVFITDWRYEKVRNDGTNYYGSHLRIATNAATRPIVLAIKTNIIAGLMNLVKTGSDTYRLTLDGGKSQSLSADLMEVFCTN